MNPGNTQWYLSQRTSSCFWTRLPPPQMSALLKQQNRFYNEICEQCKTPSSAHTHTHTHTHTQRHTHRHTQTHTDTHTQTHKHTHLRKVGRASCLLPQPQRQAAKGQKKGGGWKCIRWCRVCRNNLHDQASKGVRRRIGWIKSAFNSQVACHKHQCLAHNVYKTSLQQLPFNLKYKIWSTRVITDVIHAQSNSHWCSQPYLTQSHMHAHISVPSSLNCFKLLWAIDWIASAPAEPQPWAVPPHRQQGPLGSHHCKNFAW